MGISARLIAGKPAPTIQTARASRHGAVEAPIQLARDLGFQRLPVAAARTAPAFAALPVGVAARGADVVVLATFKGEMVPQYPRLERALNKWCVDCCNENGWEIPFPQLTVHRPDAQPA